MQRNLKGFGCRFSGRSLAALVTKSEPDNFEMIVGVGDTSTYRDDAPLPSWLAPEGDQQKCYVADEDVRFWSFPHNYSAIVHYLL